MRPSGRTEASIGKTKIPYYISLRNGETFPVAEFTSTWKDVADPQRVYTGATLCTTAANDLMGFIHNQPKGSEDYRMPAIILPEEIGNWLDTSLTADERLSIIKSFPQEELVAYSVANFKKKDTGICQAIGFKGLTVLTHSTRDIGLTQ